MPIRGIVGFGTITVIAAGNSGHFTDVKEKPGLGRAFYCLLEPVHVETVRIYARLGLVTW
jgi:hypothetical protein